jgi:hypothetical protein
MSGDLERLARAHGVWVEPNSAPTVEPVGQAATPPRKGPGRPRKSPDNLPEQGGPAPE